MQFKIKVFSIDTMSMAHFMNVIPSIVNFCSERNTNAVPSPSQRIVIVWNDDPVIGMIVSGFFVRARFHHVVSSVLMCVKVLYQGLLTIGTIHEK